MNPPPVRTACTAPGLTHQTDRVLLASVVQKAILALTFFCVVKAKMHVHTV